MQKIMEMIDNRYPNGIAHYRATYALTHPWIIIRHCISHIRWAWQRVFRGWDDRVIWSIDYYLAEKLPEWLKMLAEKKHGVPMSLFTDEDFDEVKNWEVKEDRLKIRQLEWLLILKEMIGGFYAYTILTEKISTDPEYEILKKKFERAFDLFREHFSSLWD
jgi:hypothetical protein